MLHQKQIWSCLCRSAEVAMHGLNGRLIFGQEVSSPCLLSTKRSASLSAASVTDLLTQLLRFETADTLQN